MKFFQVLVFEHEDGSDDVSSNVSAVRGVAWTFSVRQIVLVHVQIVQVRIHTIHSSMVFLRGMKSQPVLLIMPVYFPGLSIHALPSCCISHREELRTHCSSP